MINIKFVKRVSLVVCAVSASLAFASPKGVTFAGHCKVDDKVVGTFEEGGGQPSPRDKIEFTGANGKRYSVRAFTYSVSGDRFGADLYYEENGERKAASSTKISTKSEAVVTLSDLFTDDRRDGALFCIGHLIAN